VDHYDVQSSAIKSVNYDAATRVLEVSFTRWGSFRYFEVPEFTVKALLKAPSKGEYFNRCIADRFRFEQIR
jgi:KTSC domain-containing protein